MNDNGCYNRNNLINKTFNVDELKKPAVSVGFFVFCAQSVECRIYQIQKSVCRQITFLNKMFSKTKRNQKNVDSADAEERGNELMKKELIYQHIDHTLLKAVSSWEDIHKLCEEAVAHGMASVCIPPSYIKRVHEVYGDKLNICTVIGFPLGYNTTEVKRSEVEQAIAEGANWLIDAFIRGDPIVRTFFAVAIIMAGLWAGQMLVAAGATLAAHWPLILIIATLGAIVLALTSTGVTFADIFSFIGGLLGAFYGTGYNIISSLWNLFISFAEFLANVFHHPIQAIVNLFIGMATSVLTIIKDIATAIDGVFGSNLAGAVGGFSTKLKSWGDSFKADDYVSLDDMRMDTKDIAATAEAWGEKGKGVGDFIDKWDFGSALEIDPNAGGIDYSQFATAGNPATVKGTGKGGAVKVENEEDIEWMRRLAERDYIARISQNTLAPNIKVEFSGPITKEVDTDNIMSHVSEQLKEMIATAPEGVPA